MPANYIYEPIIHVQSSALSEWRLEHNFGRSVNVQLYDDSNIKMQADIIESSLETSIARFYEKGQLTGVTGKAIIS